MWSVQLGAVLSAGALVVIATGCSEGQPAARVAGTPISTARVEAILEHANEEARREGRIFAAKGTPAYRQARRDAINLLVYHEELAAKARQLGITVSSAEVEELLVGDPGEDEGPEGEAFAKESLRAALLYQRLYRRVTSDIRITGVQVAAYYRRRAAVYRSRGVSPGEARAEIARDLLTARRTAAMSAWIGRMRREFAAKVSFEADRGS